MDAYAFTNNPLDGSRCGTCKHLITRTIIPLNEIEYDIDDKVKEAIADQDMEMIFDHYMCGKLNLELDHVVIECSEYGPNIDNTLLKNIF